MAKSPSPLQALIRELDEVRELAQHSDDPALSNASLAVARAISQLNGLEARHFRFRSRNPDGADKAVEEARRTLAVAKTVLAKVEPPRKGSALEGAADAASVPCSVAASCNGCGRRFQVLYQVSVPGPLTAFPLACPWDDCDVVTEVEYPALAQGVEVVPAS